MTPLHIAGAATVIALDGAVPVRGDAFREIRVVHDATVVCRDGLVEEVGPAGRTPRGGATFDATGCTVVPGFVDAHTHLPFFGWRADEDAARLAGGGHATVGGVDAGIHRSARLIAEAGDDAVLAFCEDLARSMLEHGTTAFETKSGYGLSVDAELRQLRLARALSERVPQEVATTCLAAHAVPQGTTAGRWVGEAADDLLPRAAREGLATACDVRVEATAFDLEHAARLAEAARPLGLRMRVHADRLEDSQAAAFAARWGFATADHLNHASPGSVHDLAAGDTAAVLLPGATFTLRQTHRPPARSLIDGGAVVALGTDLDPGTSPVHSMPFVIALACRLYGLRPVEALAAATVNAAFALGLHDRLGRLAPGARADAIVLDAPTFDEVPYRPDRNPVIAVVCGGDLVHVAPRARARAPRSL